MFGLPNLKSIGAAVLATLVAGSVGYGWGRLDGAALTDAAVEKALAEAREETDNAINELASEADRARLLRRVCLDDPRGMSWDFANNKCRQAKTQP